MKKLIVFMFMSLALIQLSHAGLTNAVYWDFGPSVPSASPTSNSFAGLTVSDLTRANGGGGAIFTASSVSTNGPTAAGFAASGGTNAVASTVAGTLNLSSSAFFATAFELDLSSAGLIITNVSLASRSTGTGPLKLSLYASTDSFSSDFESLGSVAVSANSAWTPVQFESLSLELNPGETLSLRIYSSDGSGGTSNWRIDDLAVALSPAAVPEPSAIALITVGGLLGLAVIRRKKS